MLKESWEARKNSSESVVSYILSVKKKLEKMTELVQQNSSKVLRSGMISIVGAGIQARRSWCCFPQPHKNLQAQGQGPYSVVKSVCVVDYEVDMAGNRKPRRVHHVILREWHAAELVGFTQEQC